MNPKVKFFSGLLLALAGAFLLLEGSFFGERTAGVAIVLGVSGIALIATSRYMLLKK